MSILISVIIALFSCQLMAQEPVFVEPFDHKKPQWRLANWGDEAEIRTVLIDKAEENLALELQFNPNHKDRGKGMVLERDLSALPIAFDRIKLDVWSDLPDKTLSLAIAVDTDQYYESQSMFLANGWNKGISFNLRQPTFKSASTQWRNNSAVRLDQVAKKVMLLFYKNQNKEGRIQIDNVEFQQSKKPCPDSQKTESSNSIKATPRNHPIPQELPLELFLRRTSP